VSRIDDLIAEHCPSGVGHKTLGEIGKITRGRRFVKADMVESGTPCIHYGELYTKYGTWATETFSYLNPELASRLRFAKPKDVIIVSAGETVEDIGKSVAWLGNEDVVIHDALYSFRSQLDPKYVAYFSQTNNFHDQIRRYISSSKISAISPDNLGKVRIPIPPFEIQREIVKSLDAFTKLEAELEAELEARRQQYKYYRDAILTFAEHTDGTSKQASKQDKANGLG
jgi:type I restriction enzyme S subunit